MYSRAMEALWMQELKKKQLGKLLEEKQMKEMTFKP